MPCDVAVLCAATEVARAIRGAATQPALAAAAQQLSCDELVFTLQAMAPQLAPTLEAAAAWLVQQGVERQRESAAARLRALTCEVFALLAAGDTQLLDGDSRPPLHALL